MSADWGVQNLININPQNCKIEFYCSASCIITSNSDMQFLLIMVISYQFLCIWLDTKIDDITIVSHTRTL